MRFSKILQKSTGIYFNFLSFTHPKNLEKKVFCFSAIRLPENSNHINWNFYKKE